ncbi:MAG: PAS domain S-box protein [Betaproteobacteria bacterium]|nr:PAS domain S-box protein [Betaproteobacteria bacterium]
MSLRPVHWSKTGRDWLATSFASRVAFLALSLTLGVALGVGALSYAALRVQIEASIRQDLEAQTRLVEERLHFALDEAGEELETLSRNALIVNGLVDSQGRDAYLLPFLRDFRLALPGKQDIALTLHDFSGAPVIDAGQGIAIAADVVGQALASGMPQARIVAHQGEAYLELVQPVHFPPTRSIEGALTALIRMVPLLGSAGTDLSEGLHLHLRAGERTLARTGAAQEQDIHVERTLRLGAPFDALGLRLTLASPAQRVQGPLNRLTLIHVAGIFILLPLVGWFAYRGARRLVAPLERLGATVEHIAGSGAIMAPPPIEGPDEVGRLADAFGRMLERLHTAHEELEQRVRERTEALGENRAFLADLIEHSGSLIFVKDREGRYELINRKWETVTGLGRDEVLGRTDLELFPPPIGETFRANDLRVLAADQAEEVEEILNDATGMRYFLSVKFPLRTADGEVRGLCGMTTEVTERKRAELLTTCGQHVLEMIVGGHDLKEVLERLMRDVEAMTPDMLASILLLDADGVHVRHGAAPSLPDAYNRAIDGAAIGPGAGSCGTAAWHKEQVIVTDIETDPLWVDYRELALAHGLRASWSTPIVSPTGVVLGTFGTKTYAFIGLERVGGVMVYDVSTPTAPSFVTYLNSRAGKEPGELEFRAVLPDGRIRVINGRGTLECAADGRPIRMVGTAQDITEHRQAEGQLRKLAQAVEQSPESIVITNLEAEIEYVNEAFVRATGYSREEAIGQNPRILHSGKTPRETHQALWEAISHGQPWKGEFINQRKDGSEYVEFAFITPSASRMGASATMSL